MKTERLGKIGGTLYILMAIITLYNLFLSYNPTNKIFVFILANWQTILLSIFYIFPWVYYIHLENSHLELGHYLLNLLLVCFEHS